MIGDTDIYFDIRINDYKKISTYKNKIDFSALTDNKDTYLHYAIKSNSYDCARFFIKYIDSNIQNSFGETPLFYATKMGKIEMIKLLLRNNADVNIKNNVGEIALMPAIIKGDVNCVKLLIENESNIDIKNHDSKTIAHYAIIGGYDMFTYLHKKHYFDISTVDESNNTLLHYACKTNNLKIVKYILKFIYVNKKNKDKETPLFNAIRNNNHDIIKLLCQNGAIIDLNNKYGESAIDLGNKETKEYIKEIYESVKYIEYIKKYPHVIAIIKEDINYIRNNKVLNYTDSTGRSLRDYAKLMENEEIIKLIK